VDQEVTPWQLASVTGWLSNIADVKTDQQGETKAVPSGSLSKEF
jgi:hypothetical protein